MVDQITCSSGKAAEKDLFTFFNDFSVYCDNFSPDIVNAANLAMSESYFYDVCCISNLSGVSQQDCLGHSSNQGLNKTNSVNNVNERYKGKFVSLNKVKLSKRNLTRNKISLLSKGLKFAPIPRGINKALIKEEREANGRKLRLKLRLWDFRNDEREFSYDSFKKKSNVDLKRKDAAIKLSRLKEEISSLDYKIEYSNLTKGERDALYFLKSNNSIIIKEADKWSGTDRTTLKRQRTNSMIKMFTRNLQEMWKVLLRKLSKLSSKKSEIGEILATIHYVIS